LPDPIRRINNSFATPNPLRNEALLVSLIFNLPIVRKVNIFVFSVAGTSVTLRVYVKAIDYRTLLMLES